MDEINEQTYQMYLILSDEDGACTFHPVGPGGTLEILAAIKRALEDRDWAKQPHCHVEYAIKPAYQEWQE